MIQYTVKRIFLAIPLFFLITAICFILLHLAPGEPFARLDSGTRVEDTERLRGNVGLDQPLVTQYFSWVSAALQGDLGNSYVTRQPVSQMIRERLPATLELMGTSLLLSLLIGLALGMIAATNRGSWLDRLQSVVSVIGLSIPVFWLGVVAILLFAVEWGWLPTGGRASVGQAFSFVDRIRHLLLPSLVLALTQVPLWSRHMRSSLLEVLNADHIRTARAKGLSETRVLLVHALRPALLPIVTLLGVQVPGLFTGAVITESVFQWPGIGRLFFDGVAAYDYPRLMGILAISTLLILSGNLAADLANARLDPRIRLGGGK